jgi:KTSC domain
MYEYKKVPEKIFRAMQKAGSKGSYLNRHIKGNFEYKKIG